MNEVINKPSLLRKYIYEYSLIALAGCVMFLFYSFNDLNKFIREDLTKQKIEALETIKENTEILKQFKKQKDEKDNSIFN